MKSGGNEQIQKIQSENTVPPDLIKFHFKLLKLITIHFMGLYNLHRISI